MSADYDPLPEPDGRGVVVLDDDWRDTLQHLAGHSTPMEYVERLRERARRQPPSEELIRDHIAQVARLSRLIQERVDRPRAEWLDIREAARLLNISDRALYRRLQREGLGGPLSRCVSRLGHRLRFSRDALQQLLRPTPPLQPGTHSVLLAGRVPPPRR